MNMIGNTKAKSKSKTAVKPGFHMILLAAALIFSGIFSSCGDSKLPSSVTTPGNVASFGYLLVDNDDVYYTKTLIDGDKYYSSIYKYNTKNKTDIPVAVMEEVYDLDLRYEMNAYMSIYEGELYFLARFSDDSNQKWSPNIYKVKTDGKDAAPVPLFENDISCAFMQIVDGMIYYYDTQDSVLYRMKPDGTKREVIFEDDTEVIAIGKEKIYYANYDNMLMEVGINGGYPAEIYDFDRDSIEELVLEGNYLYYILDEKTFIGRIKTDGSERRDDIYKVSAASNAWILSFNISEETIYFVLDEYGQTGDYAVLSIVPGSREKVIVKDSYEFLDISPLAIWGNTVYFFGVTMESEDSWYTVSKNGGETAEFQPQFIFK